eukprot:CAMPEP_0116572242 /NCGR_PEP_ID=MMETSP0397-20121206/18059_1 /TAXON_ID=216820 /ORGANISM="Cyclophora tenuis, Strain ECT3854" /LENGTH=58 /DNA_ID=CAMNT_0004100533 /DNA_START=1113 /DNA_END=1289 /DNA_ORIENTATION=+
MKQLVNRNLNKLSEQLQELGVDLCDEKDKDELEKTLIRYFAKKEEKRNNSNKGNAHKK